MRHYLYIVILSLGYLCTPTMPLKAMENADAEVTPQVNDAHKLADVYKHRTKSIYYDPNQVRREFSNPMYMIEGLVKAFKEHDLNYCLGLLAKGVPLTYTPSDANNNMFHEALDADYAPFCQFLLDENIYTLKTLDGNRRTPLERALRLRCQSVAQLFIERGELVTLKKINLGYSIFMYSLSGLKSYDEELTRIDQIFQLLTRYDLNVNELISSSEGTCYLVDKIPCCPGAKRLQTLLPVLMKYGMQPELCNNNNETLLYRKKTIYLKDIFLNDEATKNRYVTSYAELIRLISLHYERTLEQQRIYTILAIYKLRRDSLIARLPKDVLRSIIIPKVRTFTTETVHECAQNQCAYLQKLLSIKPTTPQKVDHYSFIRQQANTAMLALLDPEKIDQHYDQIVQQTTDFIAQKNLYQTIKTKYPKVQNIP